jgi:hypothetical protein
MRIHTDKITRDDVRTAARVARVDLATFTEHRSQSRDHAFNVKLEGDSRRRPNGGASGAGSGYAATWDQWGVFLSVLLDLDPNAVTPYYKDRADFHRRTFERFQPGGILPGRPTREMIEHPEHPYRGAFRVPQYTLDNMSEQGMVWRIPGSYWPSDAHGDHSFNDFLAPRTFGCTKCSARQTW